MQLALVLNCQNSLQELGGGFAAILPGIVNSYPGWPDNPVSFPSHSLGEVAGASQGEAQQMRQNKSDLMERLQLMQAQKAALQVLYNFSRPDAL